MGRTEEQKTATQASYAPFRTDDAEKRYNIYTSKQTLFMERGFTWSESNPLVTQIIQAHKWETFCRNPCPVSIPIVKEFYANYDDMRPDSVYVRGTLVDVTSSAINSFFSLTDHQNTFFENASMLSPLTVIAILNELTKPGTKLISVLNKDINFPQISLNAGSKIWIKFIKYNLLPGSHDSIVENDAAILLYCIMLGKPINVGKVIAKQIQICASLKHDDLWFPALITRLCERHKVFPSSCERVQLPCAPLFIESESDQKTRLDHDPSLPAQSVEHGGNLVGSWIKIWWHEDKSYHKGVVTSFNCRKKMHKVLYDTRDEELLNLKKEIWELTENVYPVSDCLTPLLPTKVSSFKSSIIGVQGYMVKNNIAPVLEAIFKKHGDIAAECLFKPASMRATFLEIVCEVVRRIEKSDFTTIISEMEEIESQVSVAEAAKINVSWLRAHLKAIHKRNEAMRESTLLMEMKTNIILVNKSAQKDLKERCSELVDAQERFQMAKRCVRVLDLVEKKLRDNILLSKAEKDSWVEQSVL